MKGEEETWGDQTHCEALQTLLCCMSGPVHVTGDTHDILMDAKAPGVALGVCVAVCVQDGAVHECLA